MSDTGLSYNLSVNFRLTSNAPPLPLTTSDVRAAFEDVYVVLNNLSNAFVTLAGASPRNRSEWPLLSGSSSTLLTSNTNRLYVEASEIIAYGDIINLTNVAGLLRVQLANAVDNTRPADGFCSSSTGIAVGEVGEVILAHGVLPASGLTPGQRYYLSTTNGIMSNVPAVAAGNIEQYLGVAISSTAMYFNSGYWIQH